MKYHICCSTDDEYAQHCAVMLCSLLENNSSHVFVIHVLISELQTETQRRLENMIHSYNSECCFYQVDESKLRNIGGLQVENNFSYYAAYFRLLLSSVIDKEISIVLYLDSDIVVNADITHIFELNINRYALAAVEDISAEYTYRMHVSLPYISNGFNSGVMLLNLNYWRENNSEELLLHFVKKNKQVFFYDQDALNAVFHSQWFSLHPIWNRFHTYPYSCSPRFNNWKDEFLFKKHPLIIHYAGYLKPWYNFPLIPYRNLYLKYLRLTPWKNCPKSYKPSHTVILRLIVSILQRMHLNFIARCIAISKYRKDIQTRCSHNFS
jgi:lipopolysaccharide biosynthesis glycosyltransferase